MARPQITHMAVGRRAMESEKRDHNWEILDINNLEFPHGKIVCMFGGNNTNRPEESNGNAKIIESFLTSENRKKTNIFSFIYATEPFKSENYVVRDYEEETHILFEKSFLPMILDAKGNIKEMQGVEKAFKKLIFSSHCGGSHFANLIIDDFYTVLTQKYPEATAEMLINKIQYFSYAPLKLPTHNVNALIIAPFADVNFSWDKALSLAEEQKVDLDYPRHSVKKLIKAKNSLTISEALDSAFQESRAIVFRVGKSTFMIPGKMNPHINIGDHSIECIAKKHILNSDTTFAETAQAANYAAKTIMNVFASDSPFDTKVLFNKITQKLDENPPASEKAF